MEESLAIPIIFLVIGVIAWCTWLTVEIFSTKKDVAVNTANDNTAAKRIDEVRSDIEKRIDKFEEHVNKKFERVFDEIRGLSKK